MLARIAIGFMLAVALVAGAALYYLQVYAYYDTLDPDVANVQMVSLFSDDPEPLAFDNYKGIDSTSSPLRYRACYSMPASLAMLTETYQIVDDAEPRVAPRWFNCFDAAQLGADLESGTAIAFLGERDVQYGIDRVVAVYPDGSAFAWHQINQCGEVVFDGNAAPDDCPPLPESVQ